ncbi:uncharacterized protein LOC144704091 [Wolffia australiana]
MSTKRMEIMFITLLLLCGSLTGTVRADDEIPPSSASVPNCSSKLAVPPNSIPFNTSSLSCHSVWAARDFVLLYKNERPGLWSFVLSAPDVDAYIAVGFSPTGKMVGSSAVAGWISGEGVGIAKQYDLKGEESSLCPPDQGSLKLISGSTTIVRSSSRLYLALQLNTTTPLTKVIYAIGPKGRLPDSRFYLPEHAAEISTSINYTSAISSPGADDDDDKIPPRSAPKGNCSAELSLPPNSIPFNTSSLNCYPAWTARDFVLLYKNERPGLWSFVLSAPVVDAYIAVGFSPNGKMVGSSAVAGWITSTGVGIAKQYDLKGEESALCPPDQGRLKLVNGSTTILRSSSRLYLAFQLNTTTPLNKLIYAIGPKGRLPDSRFYLPEHEGEISTTIDYSTGSSSSGKDDDDKITPRSAPGASCSANLAVPAKSIPFDTSSLSCNVAWSARNFFILYKNDRPGLWSFVLAAPDVDAYIAVGFSPNGKMVGSSAVAGWISSTGGGIAKQYDLTGEVSSKCPPDQGNLQLVNGSTTIVRSSSRLYLAFQLNATKPLNRLIYALGPNGRLPDSSFYLAEHQAEISTSIDYSTGVSSGEEDGSDKLLRAHGLVNLIGWGVLMPVGILFARYAKSWDPAWFYSHIVIQVIGLALGIAGIVTGFRLEDEQGEEVDTHKALGLVVLVTASLQATAVLLRPGKEAKLRKFWNWYHHNVGRIAIGFAIGNIFYGLTLAGEEKSWYIGYGVFLGLWVLVTVLLELRSCTRRNKR